MPQLDFFPVLRKIPPVSPSLGLRDMDYINVSLHVTQHALQSPQGHRRRRAGAAPCPGRAHLGLPRARNGLRQGTHLLSWCSGSSLPGCPHPAPARRGPAARVTKTPLPASLLLQAARAASLLSCPGAGCFPRGIPTTGEAHPVWQRGTLLDRVRIQEKTARVFFLTEA